MENITKEVFDLFFTENYCPLEYAQVKPDFEDLVGDGSDLLVDGKTLKDVTRKNYVIYMNSDIYCQIEDLIEEAMNELNPEIEEAILDITTTTGNGDEITQMYWDTKDKLMKDFLGKLYDEYLSKLA